MKLFINLFIVGTLFCGTTSSVLAEQTMWDRHNSIGESAFRRGDFMQAESAFRLALTEAQKSGEEGSHLELSLKRLADLYKAQGRNTEAEPLIRAAAIIQQKIQSREAKKALKLQAAAQAAAQASAQGSTSSSALERSSQPSQNDKTSAQLNRGGWDGNDLRINRKFDYSRF